MLKTLFKRALCLAIGCDWPPHPDLGILAVDVQKDGVVISCNPVRCRRCNYVVYDGTLKLPNFGEGR